MSETLSIVYALTAPALIGVWVYDPTNPEATERQFLYADSRTESIKPKSASIEIAGRVNPLIEFGLITVVGLKLTVFIPFDESSTPGAWAAGVKWWIDAALNRRAINYRDNRGRLYWVALPDGVDPVDGRAGTAFSLSLQRVDYNESVL